MRLSSLIKGLLVISLSLGLPLHGHAQSTAAKQKSMTRYVNTSFKAIFGPVTREALQPQSVKSFNAWLSKAALAPTHKSSIRKIMSRLSKGKQDIKFLKIKDVVYRDTRRKGDAFIIIIPVSVQKLNGTRLNVIKIIENLKSEKDGEEDDEEDDCTFQQGEDCFCANSDNCDCVSCTGCGCGGCGGCGSSGSNDNLLESQVWW